jgi:hypothetical protein
MILLQKYADHAYCDSLFTTMRQSILTRINMSTTASRGEMTLNLDQLSTLHLDCPLILARGVSSRFR